MDSPKTALEMQIEQEARELKDAPVIEPIIGAIARCHICGAVVPASEIQPFREGFHEVHTALPQRKACSRCHPSRNIT
jgi:hypothetical protein